MHQKTRYIFVCFLMIFSLLFQTNVNASTLTDSTESNFNNGTYENTAWTASYGIGLDSTGKIAGTGTYTSDVKGASTTTTWQGISWLPYAPYGKPLPNSAATETAYSEGNADMTSNTLLLHFEDSALNNTATVSDDSGNSHDATLTTNDGTTTKINTSGKFNNALNLDGTDDYLSLDSSYNLDPGISDWSFEGWVKFNADGPGDIFSIDNTIRVQQTVDNKLRVILEGDDKLYNPGYLAIDGDYIYITDIGHYRILKLNLADLTYVAESPQTYGTGVNQFKSPQGIAIDTDYIYITDTSNHRIIKLNKSDMSWVATVGTVGVADTQLNNPKGIDQDDDYLYVADYSNNRIIKLNKSDMSFDSKTGTAGSGVDQFASPSSVRVDGNYLYVADYVNSRVVKLNKSDLSWVGTVGSYGTTDGKTQYLADITIYGDNIYATDRNGIRVVVYNKDTLTFVENQVSIIPGNEGITQWSQPWGVASNGTNLYIVAPTIKQIIIRDLVSNDFVASSKTQSDDPDDFFVPRGIANDGTYIYVLDSYNCRIVKKNIADMSYVAERGTCGTGGNYTLNSAHDITTDGTYLYIADSYSNRILKWRNSDLSFVESFGVFGHGDNQFSQLSGIHYDADGYLFVGDTTNHRVVKLDTDFNWLAEIGTNGAGDDQYNAPGEITSDSTYIYVIDTQNHRIVKQNKSDLAWVSYIGSQGSGNDNYFYAAGISTDGTYLYTGDEYNHRIVKRLNSDLSYVAQVGSNGTDDSNLSLPAYIERIGDKIYVSEQYNQRVTVLNKDDLTFFDHQGGSALSLYSDSALSTGTYHHIAVVIDNPSTLKIYIDGVLSNSVSLAYNFINFTNSSDAHIGYYNRYLPSSTIDELAVYNKALSSTEILNRYKRGILNIKTQYRACDSSTCSGEDFIGPDGTTSTYYTEATNTAITTPTFSISKDKQYFQYKITLETSDSSYTPYAETQTSTLTTTPIAPDTLTGATNSSNIQINWSSNGNDEEAVFYVENITNSTNSGWLSNTTWTETNLSCGHAYDYKIKAKDQFLTESSYSTTLTLNTSACGSIQNSNSIPIVNLSNISLGFNPQINQNDVSLSLNVDNANSVAISETKNFYQVSWQTYNPNFIYNLNDTTSKNLFIKFKSPEGFESDVFELNLNNSTTTPPTTTPTVTPTPETNSLDNLISQNNFNIGDSNKAVSELQQQLKDLGYFTYPTITGYFGPITQSALNRYLTKTTITDNSSNLDNLITQNKFAIGNANNAVRELQQKLKDLGYFTYPTITGYFGPITQTALNDYLTKATITDNSDNLDNLINQNKFNIGDVGNVIRELQQKLKDLGFFTYPSITGYFGPITQSALNHYLAK